LKFLDRFSRKAQISSFIEIRPMGAEFFHAGRRTDGQTDMTKLIVAFRNFSKAPKMLWTTGLWTTGLWTTGLGGNVNWMAQATASLVKS
jgi:hypothetical protein